MQWKKISSINGAVKTSLQHAENESGQLSYTIHKTKFKMDERTKYGPGNHRISRGGHSNLFDLRRNTFLLYKSLEERDTKAEMNYWDFKIKSFCTAEETNSKTKRQSKKR